MPRKFLQFRQQNQVFELAKAGVECNRPAITLGQRLRGEAVQRPDPCAGRDTDDAGRLWVNLALDWTVERPVEVYFIPGAQLFEPGGRESRYANELGILTLPTMILIDGSGKVVSRNIHVTELDGELKKRFR